VFDYVVKSGIGEEDMVVFTLEIPGLRVRLPEDQGGWCPSAISTCRAWHQESLRWLLYSELQFCNMSFCTLRLSRRERAAG